MVLLLSVMAPRTIGGGLLHLMDGAPSWVASLLSVGWIVPVWLLISLSERTIRRSVNERDSAVCWQCWYPLGGANSRCCPECGSPFEASELRERWRLVVWLGDRTAHRVLRALMMVGIAVLSLWLLAAVFLGLGPNLGLPFGYYGKLSRVVSRLESIPGVEVVDVATNHDVTLEDFLVVVSIHGTRRASIEFPDADAPVLLRIVHDWKAREVFGDVAE
ncbi:MAG TPA: hypothetical protein VFF69_03645 [Phycisphaerales bacterium]|nr:hypothetical protein [Phycisphaerales bacterium]